MNGRACWGILPEQPTAASGAWTDNETFTAKICFYETPFILTLRLKLSDGELALDAQSNVGFGATKAPQLVGKAQ